MSPFHMALQEACWKYEVSTGRKVWRELLYSPFRHVMWSIFSQRVTQSLHKVRTCILCVCFRKCALNWNPWLCLASVSLQSSGHIHSSDISLTPHCWVTRERLRCLKCNIPIVTGHTMAEMCGVSSAGYKPAFNYSWPCFGSVQACWEFVLCYVLTWL